MIAQQILTPGDRAVGVGAQQCLISWALMFFILENCDRDQLSPDTAASWTELTGEMLVTAVSVAGAQGVSTQVRRKCARKYVKFQNFWNFKSPNFDNFQLFSKCMLFDLLITSILSRCTRPCWLGWRGSWCRAWPPPTST